MIRTAIAALLSLAATAAAAESATPAPAARPAPKPRLVCFNEPSTGSHIRKRSCMTEEEAEARRKRDQESLATMKQKSAPRSTSPVN